MSINLEERNFANIESGLKFVAIKNAKCLKIMDCNKNLTT